MTEVIEVSLAKLEAHPGNIRKEVVRDENFNDLVEGIKAVGVIHPPVVVAHPTAKTKYRIVTGHRRLEAALTAGLKKIRVEVHEDLSEQQQRDMQYQENKHRVGNTVMERARYVAAELELGGRTVADLAKGMGVSQDQVRTSKKLSAAPGKAHAQINDGQMGLEDALTLAEFNGDPEAQEAMLDAWGSWNWRTEVQRWKNLRAAQKQAPKTRSALSAAGAQVVATPDDVGRRRFADLHLSVEEHVAAGHVATIDETGNGLANWWEPVTDDVAEEQSPDEIAAEAARKKAEEDLAAELVLAGQVRAEALKELIKTPPAGTVLAITAKAVARRVTMGKVWDLVGIPSKTPVLDVEAVLLKWSLESLLMLDDVIQYSNEADMVSTLGPWGPSEWGNDYGAGWRTRLQDVYGYQWSDLERGFMKKREEETRGHCKECGDDLTEDQREGRLCADCAVTEEGDE